MRVDLPAGCVGRSKEKWRPIKRIGVAAGGHWDKIADELIEIGLEEEAAAREAGLKKQPPGMVLLTDLHTVWPIGTDFMPTVELVDLLVAHNPGYWGEDSPYGKRLTETRLGRLLNQATNSTSTRPGGKGHRGYPLSALQMAWDRLRIGQAHPDTTSTNPVNPENPANPERESDQPEPDNAGLTEFSTCAGLQERGTGFDDVPPAFADPIAGCHPDNNINALREKLLDHLTAPGQQAVRGNGERPAAVLKTDKNSVPLGGLTTSTPGQTDRVQRALALARADTAAQATGADLTVERDPEEPKQEG
jgi:hypothetical protein